MLGLGRGRWAVSQRPKLISRFFRCKCRLTWKYKWSRHLWSLVGCKQRKKGQLLSKRKIPRILSRCLRRLPILAMKARKVEKDWRNAHWKNGIYGKIFTSLWEITWKKLKIFAVYLAKAMRVISTCLKTRRGFFYIGYHFLIVQKSCYPSLRYPS